MAFANAYGVYSTDGYSLRELTADLDWINLNTNISWSGSGFPGRPSPICLYNNAERWELVLLYTVGDNSSAASPKDVYELHFNYHPQHVKEGGNLKVSGPVSRSKSSAGTLSVGATCVATALRTDKP